MCFCRGGLVTVLTAVRASLQVFQNATFACPVIRMKQVSIAAGTIEATDVVVTEMIADEIFIVSVSALINVCRKRKGFDSYI